MIVETAKEIKIRIFEFELGDLIDFEIFDEQIKIIHVIVKLLGCVQVGIKTGKKLCFF